MGVSEIGSGSLEDRVRRMEDIELIRRLKMKYAAYCDANYDPAGLASLFTEDGVWDGGELGSPRGRAEIQEYWKRVATMVPFALHCTMNHSVDVDDNGTSASGKALLIQPLTIKGQAAWCAVTYHEHYRKVEGQWLFQEIRADTHFLTRHDMGWVKQQFMEVW